MGFTEEKAAAIVVGAVGVKDFVPKNITNPQTAQNKINVIGGVRSGKKVTGKNKGRKKGTVSKS